MHLELERVHLQSLKDFAKHYLMIVLSILTALGMEASIERSHHRSAASDASARIQAEIRANLAEIQKERSHDFARWQELGKIRDALVSDIKAHASDAAINEHFRAMTKDGFYLAFRWPVLRHEAWDVAVANQSAGWMDDDELRRYTAVYAAQNSTSATMTEDLPTVLNGPRMMDALADLQVGDVQPRELLYVVNQMATVAGEATGDLDSLIARINASMSGSIATPTKASQG
ncbi:hypothetical protein ISN76_01080 [Dyella halodurans]|uniref:Chemotaxis methyl-accepting receptor HlyB-like 4HB MCP domain-containing protein n=1 Tax=Dyella halodurans TaxID=1920171 RepID=A0ABV9BZ96_9GAMM|nr:hypothetical protein [Dyella halodurans]